MKTKSILIIVSVILLFSKHLYSQNIKEIDAIDTLEENSSSLMLNLSYTNNNLEYISGATENLPTIFTNITYFTKWGIYTGVDYSKSFGDSIDCYDYSLQAGYQKYFNNGFDIDLSYSWHTYKGDSLLEGINFDHSIDAQMGYEISKFYISANGSYKIGKTDNIFAELSLSRFIDIQNIFSKQDILMINPNIAISFGTDYWLYENMTLSEKQSAFADLNSLGYSYENFSHEGFTFYLPITYGINNIYLTASWLYKIPSNKYDYFWENQSSFMFSLTYFLNFDKKSKKK
jgi:hypothetical protein